MTKPRICVKMGRQRINAQGLKLFDVNITVKGNCNNLHSSIEEWQSCPVCEYLAKYPPPLSWRDYTWNLIG